MRAACPGCHGVVRICTQFENSDVLLPGLVTVTVSQLEAKTPEERLRNH